MHGAPSVSYPVGRSRMRDRLLLGLWAPGRLLRGRGLLQFDGADWRPALLALSVVVAGRGGMARARCAAPRRPN